MAAAARSTAAPALPAWRPQLQPQRGCTGCRMSPSPSSNHQSHHHHRQQPVAVRPCPTATTHALVLQLRVMTPRQEAPCCCDWRRHRHSSGGRLLPHPPCLHQTQHTPAHTQAETHKRCYSSVLRRAQYTQPLHTPHNTQSLTQESPSLADLTDSTDTLHAATPLQSHLCEAVVRTLCLLGVCRAAAQQCVGGAVWGVVGWLVELVAPVAVPVAASIQVKVEANSPVSTPGF